MGGTAAAPIWMTMRGRYDSTACAMLPTGASRVSLIDRVNPACVRAPARGSARRRSLSAGCRRELVVDRDDFDGTEPACGFSLWADRFSSPGLVHNPSHSALRCPVRAAGGGGTTVGDLCFDNPQGSPSGPR